MMRNIPYLLALHSIDGLGPIRLKAVLRYFKDPKLAWETNPQELSKVGIPKNTVELILETRKKLNPIEYANSIQNSLIKWLTIFDKNYPKLLKQIPSPPVVLYYKGEILPSDEKAIGVVGTRKITPYGKVVTEDFTTQLVAAKLTIVSGLALGVDSIAHKQALKSGGRTIAVLGGGLNKIFPAENKILAQEIISGAGAVISEFPPDRAPFPGNFPQRNRIIAGLSQAVLVTEAASDSGSLITARLAAEVGREVFAVPGPITSTLSKGPIELIRQGAKAVFEAKEILDELGIDQEQNTKSTTQSQISDEEKRILDILKNETMHLDEIGRKLKLPSAKISALLIKMEIQGLVLSLGSGNYCSKNPLARSMR